MRTFTTLLGAITLTLSSIALLTLAANAHTVVTPDNRLIMDALALFLIVGTGAGFILFAVGLDEPTWRARERRQRVVARTKRASARLRIPYGWEDGQR